MPQYSETTPKESRMAKKILIVDDDPDLRETSRIVLTAAGYEVVEAASGQEAAKILRADKIDLVLLDVMMESDTEGFHLAYLVREDPRLKEIPIVMLTSIEEKTGEAIDLGKSGDFLPVQAFLRKPVDARQLKARVAELIGA
jgi:CheY-like chemotaxis protein